jgi:hypothetical protein
MVGPRDGWMRAGPLMSVRVGTAPVTARHFIRAAGAVRCGLSVMVFIPQKRRQSFDDSSMMLGAS